MGSTKAQIIVLTFVLACNSAEQGASEPSQSGGTAGTNPDPSATGGSSAASGSSGASVTGQGGNIEPGAEPESPSTEVDIEVPESAGLDALANELDQVSNLSASELLERHPTPFVSSLGYDPLQASRLDTLQASALGLDAADTAILGARGFVISGRREFPSFVSGYAAIYGEHLPLYVSADSILNAVHRSYDSILEAIETEALIPLVEQVLSGMRARVQAGFGAELGGAAVADADVYLAVASGLLAGAPAELVGSGSRAAAEDLYRLATAADGISQGLLFFGVRRDVDFSQFEPRGHYRNSAALERYFRAMTWLGLADLRLIETDEFGRPRFRRRQLELSYALRVLLDESGVAAWRNVDDAIRAFVGEADNMTLPELDALLVDLGVQSPAELSSLDDQTIAQAIIDKGYGAQKISGHLLKNFTGAEIPLSSTFLLFGKRYVVDSHVFQNVVYARVPEERAGRRMMPSTLDVAFAALANDGAAPLLLPEFEAHNYVPELEKSRILVDSHPEAFWTSNLYNDWLTSLRALSPGSTVADPRSAGMPSVTGTEAWNRRILNTQLASWAELRHDTLLYAKQSYTDIPLCEFPDAYVEPYPEFFAALARFADHGAGLAASLPVLAGSPLGDAVAGYFEHLGITASRLRTLAEHERSGTEFSSDDLAFLNEIVAESENCFFDPRGWYPRLVFGHEGEKDTEFDPTIADVHTQPGDAGGSIVGRVLHVGTGPARLMVVTVDTCTGPRAYVGLASSYFERVTENFERLTDQDWSASILNATPPDVPWMTDLVAR